MSMFSMADITRLEAVYGVNIKVDTVGYRIIVEGSAGSISRCRQHLMSVVPAGLAVDFVETVRGTTKPLTKPLNFDGLWRSTKDDPHKCLLQVFEWQMGSSFNTQHDELRIKANVVKLTEGMMYPRIIELMLPKRSGVVMEVETWWYPSKPFQSELPIVELSGKVFGPPPLSREHYVGVRGEHTHMMPNLGDKVNIYGIPDPLPSYWDSNINKYYNAPLGLPFLTDILNDKENE